MKKLAISATGLLVVLSLNSQQIFTINASGLTFSPSSVNVVQGDIVRFNVGFSHPVLQVSQSTWNSNGSTALPGGFSYPSGNGDYTTTAPGTLYYICTAHISSGMKGTITVSMSSGIGDNQMSQQTKLYPNPAQGFIILETAIEFPVSEIRITDITGRVVQVIPDPDYSYDQIRIDIEKLDRGLFILTALSPEGIVVKKFLKY